MKRISSIAFALFAMLVQAPAFATTVVATYTGSVRYGYDTLGIFNAGVGIGSIFESNAYFGQTIVTRFEYDTNSIQTSSTGGIIQTAITDLLSATVTLNGHTVSINPTYFSVSRFIGLPYVDQLTEFATNAAQESISTSLFGNDPFSALPVSLDGTFVYIPLASNGTDIGFGFGQDVNIDANISSLSVAPVPEPATWIMLLIAFGMTGLEVYRRNRATCLTASRSEGEMLAIEV